MLGPSGFPESGQGRNDRAQHHAGCAAVGQRHSPPRPAGLRRQPGDHHHRARRRVGRRHRSPRWPSGPSGWPRPWGGWASGDGDRVGTFLWNNQTHLEAYLAIPAMGAVLHTLNLRLFPEQLAYVINHAEDQVIIVRRLAGPSAGPGPRPADHGQAHRGGRGRGHRAPSGRPSPTRSCWPPRSRATTGPTFDERQAAAMCYTVGHHRQPEGRGLQPPLDLPALDGHHLGRRRSASTSGTGCCRSSRCSTPTPGARPTRAFMTGADLIMPQHVPAGRPAGRPSSPGTGPTLSAGVPTIWSDLLRYAQTNPVDLSSLRMITAGGAAVPRQLIERFRDELGVEMVQGWGMTETSPLCSLALPPAGHPPEEEIEWRAKTGRVVPGVEVRVVAEDGIGPAQRRRVGGGVRGPGPVDHRLLLRRPGTRAVPRRLAAHRRHRHRSTAAASCRSATGPRT